MAKAQSHESGPSAHAGVPSPNLPPLPPSVAQAGPPPAPAAGDVPPPPAPNGATATIAPAPAAAPMGPESFNAQRKGLGGGGFNPRLLGIPVVIVIALVGMWMNRGTTTADDLKAGDCFVMPASDDEFDRLDTEPCDMAHDGQIIAEVELDGPNSYPPDASTYWQSVFNACAQQADTLLIRADELPADTELNFFSPVAEGWERMGDRTSLCYIHSPGGLSGSFLG